MQRKNQGLINIQGIIIKMKKLTWNIIYLFTGDLKFVMHVKLSFLRKGSNVIYQE